MSDSPGEIPADGATLAVEVGLLIYATQGTGLTADPGACDLKVSFRLVEDISVGTNVRMAGLKIGTVTALDSNPRTFRAYTPLNVRGAFDVPENTSISISSSGEDI